MPMTPLTVTDVRALLPASLDLAELSLDVDDPDPLEIPLGVAQGLLPGMIGWTTGSVPDALVPLMKQATALLAIRQAVDLSPDRLETMIDFDLLQSFSAGGYSEQRRSPQDALKIRQLGLTGWPVLDGLLVALMDEAHRERFDALILGYNAPAFAVSDERFGGDWYGEQQWAW